MNERTNKRTNDPSRATEDAEKGTSLPSNDVAIVFVIPTADIVGVPAVFVIVILPVQRTRRE